MKIKNYYQQCDQKHLNQLSMDFDYYQIGKCRQWSYDHLQQMMLEISWQLLARDILHSQPSKTLSQMFQTLKYSPIFREIREQNNKCLVCGPFSYSKNIEGDLLFQLVLLGFHDHLVLLDQIPWQKFQYCQLNFLLFGVLDIEVAVWIKGQRRDFRFC